MEPLVLAYMSHRDGYLERFQKQLIEAGIEFDWDFDEKFSWRRMVKWQGEKGGEYPDRLLIFVGGWDTLLMGTKKEILDLKWDNVITFAGDKVCWPDGERAEEYASYGWTDHGGYRGVGPWRFINTGPTMSPGWMMKEAVDWGEKWCPLEGDDNRIIMSGSGTDMRFWTNIHLLAPFPTQVDYRCQLGQTALGEFEGDFSLVKGRIKNNLHGTFPVFLHLNGQTIAPEGLK